MKIAIAQIDCVDGDSRANTSKILNYIEKASAAACRLIIFPEMSDTGYDPGKIPACASSWDDEQSPLSLVKKTARQQQINVALGLSEKDGTVLCNSLAVVSDKGALLAKYRKVNLFPAAPFFENSLFKAGNDLVCLEIDNLNFGLSICYDLRFPKFYQQLAIKGAKVLINIAAWPQIRVSHWDVLTRARAIENQCYFIGASRVGTYANLKGAGQSRVVSPTGDLLVNGTDQEQLLITDINPQEVDNFRASMPSFQQILKRTNPE